MKLYLLIILILLVGISQLFMRIVVHMHPSVQYDIGNIEMLVVPRQILTPCLYPS
jgi:hypothetical protein